MTDRTALSLSIVSHGQGILVSSLLDDLSQLHWNNGLSFEIIITLNIPEDEGWLGKPRPFPLRVLHNKAPRGFGANHNAAFRAASGEFFAVVNPDIRLAGFEIAELVAALEQPNAGVCGPLVKAPNGAIEDSARRFPTFGRLLLRKLLRQRDPDYRPGGETIPVDWLAGMFLLFPSAVYRKIGGFDERYFMYIEDVEISRHLRRYGLQTLWVRKTAVVHDASRASRRNLRHMRWHVTGFLRYFFGRPRT